MSLSTIATFKNTVKCKNELIRKLRGELRQKDKTLLEEKLLRLELERKLESLSEFGVRSASVKKNQGTVNEGSIVGGNVEDILSNKSVRRLTMVSAKKSTLRNDTDIRVTEDSNVDPEKYEIPSSNVIHCEMDKFYLDKLDAFIGELEKNLEQS